MVWGSMFCCVQLVLTESGLMSCVTSLMDVGCMELSLQLRGLFIYMPLCWQDNVIGDGIYDCAHRCTGNLAPNISRRDKMKKFCSDEDTVPVNLCNS